MRDLENGYEEYKFNDYLKTELPSHWINKRLSYLAREDKSAFVDGPFGSDLKSSDYIDSGVPLIQLNNIRDSKHVMQNLKFITEEKKLQLNRHLAIPGDVVIAKMADPVARSAVVRDYFYEYVIVADCVKMSPNLHLVNLEYLVWAINCDYVRINAELVATGTTRIRVNLGELKKLKIPYPPLDEQQKIANFLDHETAKIDTLIAKQQQLIQLLKEKRQAVISHAVTKGLNPDAPMRDSGVEWLGEVPAHWVARRLKHTSKLQSGIPKGKDLTGKNSIAIPMLRVANVQDGYLNLDDVHTMEIEPDQLERYTLEKGDVLMNEGGDNDKLGRGTVWQCEIVPCIHQNHVFVIRPHSIEAAWLDLVTRASYAKFHFFRVSKQSTNLASISSTNIKETPLIIPPEIERIEIMNYVKRKIDAFENAEVKCSAQIELLQERRTALISAAVTGKIDVRNWVSPDASSTANTPNTSDSTATTNSDAAA